MLLQADLQMIRHHRLLLGPESVQALCPQRAASCQYSRPEAATVLIA
jgi:hypothetical protein